MLLTPAQTTIASDLHRFRVINCGRRFGKTTLAVEEIKGKAIYKNSRIAYIAPTYQQARDLAWEVLKKELSGIVTSSNESRLEIKVANKVNGESVIILRGWESIETLRGQYFDFIVIDEIASMRNFDLQWEEVIRPTLTDKKGEVMFISTPKGFNHFYELFCKEVKDDDYKSFHFTTYDNPFIPIEEIEKAKLEMTEDRFSQEYLADFRKTQGLVYKDFDRTKHVFTEMPPVNIVDRLVGIDWGWTNPAAIHLVLKDHDAHYWITDEYYKTQKTTSELIDVAKSYRGNKYYPDPAEPDRAEEMRRAGLNLRDVSNDIEAGISTIQELLKTGRLHVGHRCLHLISEFETYSYPDKKPDKNRPELPIDENNHALADIRYVLHAQEPAGMERGRAKQFVPSGHSARRGYQVPR